MHDFPSVGGKEKVNCLRRKRRRSLKILINELSRGCISFFKVSLLERVHTWKSNDFDRVSVGCKRLRQKRNLCRLSSSVTPFQGNQSPSCHFYKMSRVCPPALRLTLLHSNGSSWSVPSTSPRPTSHLTRDVLNHHLWNPKASRLDDAGGDVEKFQQKFGLDLESLLEDSFNSR